MACRTRTLAAALAVLALAVPVEAKTQRSRAVTQQFQKLHPCPATGKATGACPGWVKDHVVPLCAGGPDAVRNMQWQTKAEAAAKDRAERAQCRRTK
jgi:hypothetical protein